MCTVVVSFQPGEPVPLRLLGIRDELVSRPWRPPGRHWPGSPLIGGIDQLAGGTWLALHPAVPRVACLLNGRGQPADPDGRRSRGELPLRAAADGPGLLAALAADPGALAPYDPFHLICAELDQLTAVSWLGRDTGQPRVRALAPGTHLFTNAGHAYPAGPGDPPDEPKAAHFADKFAAAHPPARPGLPPAQAWGDWLTLAAGDDLDPAGLAAILVRRELPDGQLYGTGSMTLVALAADGRLRYDFQPRPGDPASWYQVATG